MKKVYIYMGYVRINCNLTLRCKLNFKGMIMTDDICMKALKENLVYRTLQPLIAGYDIILHCNGNINEMEKIVSIIKKWKNRKI